MIDERLGSNPGRLRFLDPSGEVTPTKDLICQPSVSSDAYAHVDQLENDEQFVVSVRGP
jgi:hypothetical protein